MLKPKLNIMKKLKWYWTNIISDDGMGERLLLSEEDLIEIYRQYGDGQGHLREGYFLQQMYTMSV
jgi:hypothetical protein